MIEKQKNNAYRKVNEEMILLYLERMIQFYSTYKDDEIATPLVTQLSWTNNLLILSGAKNKE